MYRSFCPLPWDASSCELIDITCRLMRGQWRPNFSSVKWIRKRKHPTVSSVRLRTVNIWHLIDLNTFVSCTERLESEAHPFYADIITEVLCFSSSLPTQGEESPALGLLKKCIQIRQKQNSNSYNVNKKWVWYTVVHCSQRLGCNPKVGHKSFFGFFLGRLRSCFPGVYE